ncbi:MAG TPA: ANTAR domain-containing protein [Streptomyces sp.]
MPVPRDDAPARRAGSSVALRLDGDRAIVTVSGELCLDDHELLEHTLHSALRGPVRTVEIDLGGVVFWDCSALNTLLAARDRATSEDVAFSVTAVSPVAAKLLALTETQALLEPPDDDGLRAEVAQLRRAMATRPEIDMARGILMASFRLDADQAWNVLVMASQNTNTKLHRLAASVVTTVQGTPLPDPVQHHLTEAVARVSVLSGKDA